MHGARIALCLAVASTLLAGCRGRLPRAVEGEGEGEEASEAFVVGTVDPDVVEGGSIVTVSGEGFATAAVFVGGEQAVVVSASTTSLRVKVPALPPGATTLAVEQRGVRRASTTPLVVWSPDEIDGARVFDADFGIEAEDDVVTRFEWQRLTPVIDPAWRVRDGNTLTWLPSQQRFFMVGGWNGYQAPEGFSTIDPNAYPPENTTTEVWSTADGTSWRLERPHGDTQFERRHSHNTMLWHDALWMIGGDFHQGKENHDVVTSDDGVHWRVVLGPGAAQDPPWSRRVLQVSGVYDGKLWTTGGQDVNGVLDDVIFHNDVWNTDDGEHWVQVAADAPASDTRWAGCGVNDGLVEFHGELWLVGCARERADAVGHSMSHEVWSTRDGVDWTRHQDPPWTGKIWPNVVVWQDRLWIFFGYTYGDAVHQLPPGNANEVWFSVDGETWDHLPFDAPTPGSHAQGIGVTDDALVYAGGNYSFGFGDGEDKSAWRLVPVHGRPVTTWHDRGGLGLALRVPPAEPTGATAPIVRRDAFADGRTGVDFDGSTDVVALLDDAGAEIVDEVDDDDDDDGFSIFFVARAPTSPSTWGWVENYNPSSTVVGNIWPPRSSLGLTNGAPHYVNRRADLDDNGGLLLDVVALSPRTDLQSDHGGTIHDVAVVHHADGRVVGATDGTIVDAGISDFDAVGWSRIGGGVDGPSEGVDNRFAGSIGAVVIVHRALSDDEVQRLHQWARGRFHQVSP
jgi:hypothetical protein